MSASRELSPDWVLSSFIHSSGKSRDEIMELADAARRLWPGVQAHARKEQPGKSFDDVRRQPEYHGSDELADSILAGERISAWFSRADHAHGAAARS
jgi:hypothetical protein